MTIASVLRTIKAMPRQLDMILLSITVILVRTSIILDDELGKNLRAAAQRKGMSLSAFLADAGRAALRATPQSRQPPFELITFGEGGVQEGVDLDQTSDLLAAEDAAKYGQ